MIVNEKRLVLRYSLFMYTYTRKSKVGSELIEPLTLKKIEFLTKVSITFLIFLFLNN